MNCKRCGAFMQDGSQFCTQCGYSEANSYSEQNSTNAYTSNQDNVNAYGNNANAYGNAYANNPNGAYNGNGNANVPPYNANGNAYAYQNVNPYGNANKIPDTKEYLKWMLAYPLFNLIPVAGSIIYFVLCIKNALDKTYPARANYFKSLLIIAVISAAVGVVVSIVVVIATTILGISADYIFTDNVFDMLSTVFIR